MNIFSIINIMITILVLVIGGFIKWRTSKKIRDLDGLIGIQPKHDKKK